MLPMLYLRYGNLQAGVGARRGPHCPLTTVTCQAHCPLTTETYDRRPNTYVGA